MPVRRRRELEVHQGGRDEEEGVEADALPPLPGPLSLLGPRGEEEGAKAPDGRGDDDGAAGGLGEGVDGGRGGREGEGGRRGAHREAAPEFGSRRVGRRAQSRGRSSSRRGPLAPRGSGVVVATPRGVRSSSVGLALLAAAKAVDLGATAAANAVLAGLGLGSSSSGPRGAAPPPLRSAAPALLAGALAVGALLDLALTPRGEGGEPRPRAAIRALLGTSLCVAGAALCAA